MRSEHLVNLNGKIYPLYAGVLEEAHARGLQSIDVDLVQIPSEANGHTAIARATVVMAGGATFIDYGDANSKNVRTGMATALVRLAATRAKGRALRDATNIGQTMLEELPDDHDHGDPYARPAASFAPPRADRRPPPANGKAPAGGPKPPAHSPSPRPSVAASPPKASPPKAAAPAQRPGDPTAAARERIRRELPTIAHCRQWVTELFEREGVPEADRPARLAALIGRAATTTKPYTIAEWHQAVLRRSSPPAGGKADADALVARPV